MAKNIKQRRVGTQVKCPKCNKDVVWCAFQNSRILFRCADCEHSWASGPEECSIRSLKVTSESQALTVFHGFWLKEEIERVEDAFRKLIIATEGQFRDEWAFFKGRQLYSAWRLATSGSGVVMAARNLVGLIEKVVVKCRQSQNL